ncbi:bifunctional 5,10-methylenetetrahydrofolate dehydrogenase/5,10-methenyltetrahydrofolate cyclohydrolase [Candidatus Shapirobacteria bacterium]|nr:bifunctional 5,10-methylenetetrahydrofolate dehydrogenase/5,10-methenyltetrahydrofolate cyclohydrolase [Candidatus Shapirobacteria bacterium]
MVLLDGKTLANKIISNLQPRGTLHIILVGDNPASLKYVSLKQQKCQEIGQDCVIHSLPQTISEQEIISLINNLNNNPQVTGFFVQLPLPSNLDKNIILSSIVQSKDVDGLTPNSPYTPAVVKGIVHLLIEYQLLPTVKTAVIINDSNLIGKPLEKFLLSKKIQVTLCNEFTKNISEISRGADLLISATGVKGLVTKDYIKPGAIVIDAASGDVNFTEVSEVAGYITPTYGCIGPLTIACLLENLTSPPTAILT